MRKVKKLCKRSFALFLAAVLCISVSQITVFAEDVSPTPSVSTIVPTDVDIDANVDADSKDGIDTNVEVDSDADVNVDSDINIDVNADSNTDTDADADINITVNTDSEADASDEQNESLITVAMPLTQEVVEEEGREEIYDKISGDLLGYQYSTTDENGVETRKFLSPIYGQDGSTIINYKVSTTKIVPNDQMPEKPENAPAVKDKDDKDIEGSYEQVNDNIKTVALPLRNDKGEIIGYQYTEYDNDMGTVLDVYVLTTTQNVDLLDKDKTEVIEAGPKPNESVKVEVTSPNVKPTPPEGYTETVEGSHEYTKSEDGEGGTIIYTWKWEEVKNSEGEITGYVIKATKETTIKDKVPDEKPKDAVDIDGGYQYTTTLEDGTERIVVVQVNGEEATIVTTDVTTEIMSSTATGNFKGDIDPDSMLEKPEPPKEYEYDDSKGEYTWSEPIEDGNTTGTVDYTWKLEEIKDNDGNVIGYVTTTTEKKTTESRVPNVPTNKPVNAVDIEGGYRYTTEETLEDGRIRTTVTTVINGETITRQTITTTTKTRQEITVNEEGSITVTVTGVIKDTGHGSDGDYNYITIKPNLEGEYDWKGYDAANDLYDREGFKGIGLGRITVNTSLNVRSGPGTGNKVVASFQSGDAVYIYDIKDGWYRIGENAWISASDEYVKPMFGTFQVKKGCYVYKNPGDAWNSYASRAKDSIVHVDEVKTDKNGNITWYHITSDGNHDGWIEAKHLEFVKPNEGKTPDVTMAKSEHVLEELFPNGYDYVYLGESGLESSIRVDTTNPGAQNWQAHQFILRDKKNNKFYVYCADFGTGAKSDYHYSMKEISESDYLNSDKMQHLNDIALNGYWGTTGGADEVGSLDALKENLKEYLSKTDYKGNINELLKQITPGIALTATQAALWFYGNTDPNKKVNADNFDDWEKYLGTYFVNSEQDSKDYSSRKDYEELGKSKGEWEKVFTKLDADEKEALKTVFNWLINLDENTPGANVRPEKIDETNFATNMSVEVTGSCVDVTQSRDPNVVYKANVSFAMKVTPSQINDDLIVKIFVNGEEKVTKRIAGNDEKTKYGMINATNDVYTITGIELPNGASIDIVLTGTQDLGNGVYIFSSEELDGETSQTFIGLSKDHKGQEVNLKASLMFNVTEAKAVVTTTRTENIDPGTPYTWSTGDSWSNVTERGGGDDDTDSDDDDTPDGPTPQSEDPEDPIEEIPEDPVPLTNIPNDPVPLANVPLSVELAEIPDEDVPLAGLTDIFDEDVPLADVPETGDISVLWYVLILASGVGLLVLRTADAKKRKNSLTR